MALLATSAAVLVAVVAPSGNHAVAGTTGSSPVVYATGGAGVEALEAHDLAGPGRPVTGSVLGHAGTTEGPIAVNSTGTRAVVGVTATAAAAAIPVDSAVVVSTGASGPGQAATSSSAQGTGSVGLAGSPVGFAMDPADQGLAFALVASSNDVVVQEIDIATSPPKIVASLPRPPLPPGLGDLLLTPRAIAVSPDGARVYVAAGAEDLNIVDSIPVSNPDLATVWTQTSSGGIPRLDVAVAPNGTTLYGVATGGPNGANAFALSLPLTAASRVIWSTVLPTPPNALALSPDGQHLYVVEGNGIGSGRDSALQQLNAGSGAAATPVEIPIETNPAGGDGATGLVETPDQSSLLVYGENAPNGVTEIDQIAPGASAGTVYPVAGVGAPVTGPQDTAITPDQAPVAKFTYVAARAGSASTFDASPSSVAYGSITGFAWNFGDGSSTTTPGPTVSHVFAAKRVYKVTLTETDSAGISVPSAPFTGNPGFAVNGTGQTPYLDAGISAAVAEQVPIAGSTGSPPTLSNQSTTTTTTHTTTSLHHTTTAPAGKKLKPKLVLSPNVGPPGTIVEVTGSGFAEDTPITISWSLSSGSVVATTTATGTLTAQLFILTPDVLGPRFAVASSSPRAEASFLVVPSSWEPGGDDGSFLFRSEGP